MWGREDKQAARSNIGESNLCFRRKAEDKSRLSGVRLARDPEGEAGWESGKAAKKFPGWRTARELGDNVKPALSKRGS